MKGRHQHLVPGVSPGRHGWTVPACSKVTAPAPKKLLYSKSPLIYCMDIKMCIYQACVTYCKYRDILFLYLCKFKHYYKKIKNKEICDYEPAA